MRYAFVQESQGMDPIHSEEPNLIGDETPVHVHEEQVSVSLYVHLNVIIVHFLLFRVA